MMRERAMSMGLVGLALASAFMAKEAREKARDTVVSVRHERSASVQHKRSATRRGRASGKFGAKRLRRLRRAEARGANG